MVVCINCSIETKDKMDNLLSKNLYRDYSELLSVAIDNLFILEHEVAGKDAFIFGNTSSSSVLQSPQSSVKKPKSVSTAKTSLVENHIPDLFITGRTEQISPNSVKVPLNQNNEEVFTIDRWLFGQYNKLLPAKVNCRALLNTSTEYPNGAPLDEIATRISRAAELLGDYLIEHDRQHNIGRDDALATAFPHSGPDSEKSCTRYANQFVGSINSQGILSGLLWDYRFIVLASGEKNSLLLTEPAAKFAKLKNPVLDVCQITPTQKFTLEEVSFILDHICAHVPVETFTFRTLIQRITDKANTPDKLDEALQMLIPKDSNRSLSQSFLTSQRSGALSRMADLGLIARERKGVKVSYIVTEQGQQFIESQ